VFRTIAFHIISGYIDRYELGKITAQDAFVRVCTQKYLYQCGEAQLLRFFSPLSTSLHTLSAAVCPFPVGQKAVINALFKNTPPHVADIASFLRQRLLAVLLRLVVTIVLRHGTTAVVPEFHCWHQQSLQVPA
jgi:hypothetical protein